MSEEGMTVFESARPASTETVFQQRLMHRIRLSDTQICTREAIEDAGVDVMTDYMRDALMARLSITLMGEPRAIWDEELHSAPATWWDMWKRQHPRATRWLRLAAPRTRSWTRVRRRTWTDLYPHAPLPRDPYGDRVVVTLAE